MNKDDLILLVQKIQSADGTEEEIGKMIDDFVESVPDPSAVDYIFEKEYENLTPEEIVCKSLSYIGL